MDETKHSSHQHGTPARESIHHDPPAYWRRAHHDWRFWVALFFMLTAITIYILSDDLALMPRGRPRQAQSGAVSK
jgi:hypothetical protein